MTQSVEEDLIGLLLLEPIRYFGVADTLRPEHFVDRNCGAIYAGIQAVNAAGSSFSLSLVETHSRAKIEGVTLAGYLARLKVEAQDNLGNVDEADLAATLVDGWYRRRFNELLPDLAKLKADASLSGEGMIEKALQRLGEVVDRQKAVGGVTLAQSADATVERIQARWRDQGAADTVPTGIEKLDRLTGPLQRGEMTVIGARPGAGKTAIALSIAKAVAQQGRRVLFFSLEMSEQTLTERLLASATFDRWPNDPVPYRDMRTGQLTQAQMEKIVEVTAEVSRWPISIEAGKGKTASQMRLLAALHARREGVDLIIGDYLGLVRPEGRYKGDRTREVGETSKGLIEMAQAANAPLIMLHQLSREVEKRQDHRPHLADLRESGDIEQDADVILFLYRQSYYLAQEGKHADAETFRHSLEVICAKNRSGPTGAAELWCDLATNTVRSSTPMTHADQEDMGL